VSTGTYRYEYCTIHLKLQYDKLVQYPTCGHVRLHVPGTVGCARRDEKLDPACHILPVILAVSFLSVSQKIFNEIYSDIACPRPFLRGSNDIN
jgi:hypothetical protein